MGVVDIVARNLASSMFGKFGQSVTLKESQTGDYDSTTDTVKLFAVEHVVSAIIAEFSASEIKGLVKTGDKKVLIAAKDLPRVPRVDWTIKIGSRWHTIHHVETTYSGEDPAIHEIVARGTT